MKKIYRLGLILLLSFYASTSPAQKLDIFWGKEHPVDRFASTNILTKRGDALLGYKRSGSKMFMIKYSLKDLLIKTEIPIIGNASKNPKLIDNDYSFNEFIILKNKMYITVSKYDRKADLNSVYAQEIDNGGNLTGSFKKLSDISSKSRRNSGSFSFYAGADSSKFLLVNNPPYEKYAGEKFGYKIFDSNLKETHNLEVSLPYKDSKFSAEDYILSKDGTIYLLAKIYLEKKEKEKGEAEYYYEIVAIDPNGQGKVTEYEVKLPGKHITDLSYSLDDTKGIICSGFYGNIEKKGRNFNEVNGVFYLRLNKETKAVEASGIKELDKDFIAELTSKKKADKGRGISSTFKMKDFIRKDDGGSLLVAESSYMYVVTTTTTSNGVTTTRTDYHYIRENILVININADGSIKWCTNIPKYQHTVNDGGMFSSFMMSTFKDKMFFIYNDNPKNLDPTKVKSIKDIRPMNRPSKSMAVIVELAESGEFSKKMLFSNKENKSTLMPGSSCRISDKEQIATTVSLGIYCCFIPLKSTKTKLVRFSFK